MPRLYDYFRSSASYRVRIALNLKGIAAELKMVDLRTGAQYGGEYEKVNPLHGVPCLVEDDGKALPQSLAIIEYLNDTHPTPPLLPQAAYDRAWVRAVAQAVACDIHPVNNLRILNYLRDEFGQDEEARNKWYRHWIAQGLTGIEAMLAESSFTGTYCYGDAPTLADICLVPQVYNAERFNSPLDNYPTIRRIVATARAHPAFAAADPAQQPQQ